jgi:hypothetical protein
MPIDELTTDPEAAYPRLGILRKGSPKRKMKKNGKEIEIMGEDLDHFRFVTDNHNVLTCFKEVYGDKPREINVYLPFATKDENLDAWMKEYGAGSVKVKCTRPKDREDGIVLWQEDGLFRTDPKPCQWPNCACKPHGVLTVIIPELVPIGGIGAVWVLTTSWNDCGELAKNLAAAEKTASSLGRDLRGIPFVLSRRLDDVSCPPREGTNGKRVRDEKWMLHIEPHPAWVAEQIEAQKRLASPLNAPALSAPAGPSQFDELFYDDEEEGEIEYPETEIMPEEPEFDEQETDKLAFYQRVEKGIPFFKNDTTGIADALRGSGFTGYNKAKEDEMFASLQNHASHAANEEAA